MLICLVYRPGMGLMRSCGIQFVSWNEQGNACVRSGTMGNAADQFPALSG